MQCLKINGSALTGGKLRNRCRKKENFSLNTVQVVKATDKVKEIFKDHNVLNSSRKRIMDDWSHTGHINGRYQVNCFNLS